MLPGLPAPPASTAVPKAQRRTAAGTSMTFPGPPIPALQGRARQEWTLAGADADPRA
jgi:hypothetical protein